MNRFILFKVYAKHMFVGLLWVDRKGYQTFRAVSGGWTFSPYTIDRVSRYKQLNLRRVS